MRSPRSTTPQDAVRSPADTAPPSERDKSLFQGALTEALESPDIAATLDRAPTHEINYLRELTTECIDKLWDEVSKERSAVDSVEAELSRLRDRTKNPVGWAIQHLVTGSQLQTLLATTGLFLVTFAYALPFLTSTYARSAFSRLAILLGLLILAVSSFDGLVRLLVANAPPRKVAYQLRNAIVGSTIIGFTIASSTGILSLSASLPNLGNFMWTVVIVVAGLLMISSVFFIR